MSMTVAEIEMAIKKLPPTEIPKLSEWFEDFEARIWDKKIKRDLQSGKLQNLIEEAEADFAKGKCQPL